MQNYPSSRLIPTTTVLTPIQITLTKRAIARRMGFIRTAAPETALFYMEEVQHLRELLKNNEPKIAA